MMLTFLMTTIYSVLIVTHHSQRGSGSLIYAKFLFRIFFSMTTPPPPWSPWSCFYCIFHLKLESLTQFPASNDKKWFYFFVKIRLLSWVICLTEHLPLTILSISVTLFGVKSAWSPIYLGFESNQIISNQIGLIDWFDLIVLSRHWWS